MSDPAQKLRVDKWLWHARFFKTRSLAAKIVTAGAVRLNGTRIAKSAVVVGPGDVLTFAKGDRVCVVRVLEIGTRRGPASEAQALYEDLSPPPPPRMEKPSVPRFDGGGRPTKRDRRKMDQSRRDALE
ncbi:RNA-binding S4 domain-containing protein [Primorskyibacter flagellatus]|uniref:Heat shock protein Hsp15 n=1 Tax=Primorskyibacter flagellatus TaxID=1387277 RepID=A0A1W2D6U7_9RHOB|nr:RNA-binding S4 domain-containing protein [Primorskyibacter flagellatus]SMC93290.1 heat shock protein Hsp15 [Primorskyibacter flagellatus]